MKNRFAVLPFAARVSISFVLLLVLAALAAPSSALVAAGGIYPDAVGSQGQEASAQEPAKPVEKKEEKKEEKKRALPLKPERKVEFTTSEGTWLSLDVSPDGKTLVFELLGDLYTLPIEGGEAKRLAVSDSAHKDGDGMAFDSQPRYSPDGKWVAFSSDRDGADNLWLCKADGTEPRQLTREKQFGFVSPAWTPDSQYVVVNRFRNIWMYHVYGGSGLNVTGVLPWPAPPSPVGLGVAFSPDGRYLYFSQKDSGSDVYNQMTFGVEIARRDMKTGAVDQVTQAQFGAVRPAISRDGRWLVYGTRYETQTGLRIRNLETGQDRWLKYPIQRDGMETGGLDDLLPGYAFMPDSRELVLSYDGKIQRLSIENGAAREIPFTAKVSLELGPLLNFQRRVEEGPVRARLLQDPALSPDGKRLAFSAMTSLYVMDLPGGTPRRLTSSDVPEFKPAWSPDGQWIAFVTWEHDGVGHLWKVRSDPSAALGAGGSGQPQRLTSVPAFYTDPVFSPDGTRIVARRGNAFMRVRASKKWGGVSIPLDIVWLPADPSASLGTRGGEVTMIVPARGLSGPHFTREKDRVYFYAEEGLVSMRYDATDRQTHVRITGRGRPWTPQPAVAESAVMSPDGRWALARVDDQIFVLAVPVVGGQVPNVNVFSGSVPVKQLTDIGADSYAWADDGKTVAWAVGTTVFRRPFDSIPFDPALEKQEAERKPQTPAPAKQEEKKEEKKPEPKKPHEQDKGVESFEVVLEFPRHAAQGTIVLRGATVVTMKGDEVIPNADLVVTDNRFTAVGPRGKVAIPVGAKVMDLRGAYIVPGFVDTHAHYAALGYGVLETHNWSYLANLAYGVTTGLDVQTSTNAYLTYTDLVDAGKIIGPRSYSTGPGVYVTNDFQSAEAAKFVLEKYKKYYRNHNLKSYMVGNRQQRQWVVQAAKELELTVTTEGGFNLKLDLTHAIDGFGGNEHTLPIVPLYKDVVELFAQGKTGYTPTLLVLYGGPWAENFYYETTEVHDDAKLNRFTPHNEVDRLTRRRPWFRHDEHSFPQFAAQAVKIQRAGGFVGVGAHGQLQGLGYHWEMWSLASGGMSPREVLKAATIDGAHIVGLQQDLGSIEPGKLADLVILTKDPFQDIRNTNSIRYVMKNGELFEGDTLNQLWPVEKPLPPLWWWKDKP